MKLTKEKAIRLHRELWGWLAENPMKKKHNWPGWKDNGGEHPAALSDCFCCQYARNVCGSGRGAICGKCPLEWERLTLKISSPCLNSYFGEWEKATAPEERSRLAALIRDLPEKKVEPKPEFKVGDWVKVRGDLEVDSRYDDGCRFTADMGPYRGKTGVITKERLEDRFYLDLTGSSWCWSPSMLEPAEPPKSTSKFAVGDKVVPISKNTSGHPFSSVMKAMRETDHKYLEIRKINQEWDGRGGIVEAGWIGLYWFFLESDLVPYTGPIEEPKFQPGAKVVPVSKTVPGFERDIELDIYWRKSKERGYLFVVGIEESLTKSAGKTVYMCNYPKDATTGNYFLESDLRPYVEPKPEPEFKRGDKVVPIGISGGGWTLENYKNYPTKIPNFLRENGYLCVNELKNGKYLCGTDNLRGQDEFYPSELIPYTEPEKQPEPNPPAFKIGDKVKAVKATRGWGYVKHGDIGIITEVPSNPNDCYAADFPAQKYWLGNKECFELVNEDPKPEPTPEPKVALNVGDRVRVDGNIGTIKGITGDPPLLGIEFDNPVINGHDFNKYLPAGKKGHCFFHLYREVELLPINHCPENKTVTKHGATFTFSGPTTICIIEAAGCKFKGVAKCAPEDTWKEITGEGWAYLRAMRKLLNSLEKNLREE